MPLIYVDLNNHVFSIDSKVYMMIQEQCLNDQKNNCISFPFPLIVSTNDKLKYALPIDYEVLQADLDTVCFVYVCPIEL